MLNQFTGTVPKPETRNPKPKTRMGLGFGWGSLSQLPEPTLLANRGKSPKSL